MLKEVLEKRHKTLKQQLENFAFSLTYSPDLVHEISMMGTEFTDKYQYTVATIPGSKKMLICINLKERK